MERGDPGASDEVREFVMARPGAALRPYVDWYAGYREAEVAPGTHRGLPSPQLTLIFTLDEPLEMAAHPDPRQPPGSFDALVGGLHTRPALITHPGRQSGVQIALSAVGARALLGLPAGEIASRDLAASDVLGGAFVDEMRGRLLAARSWAERTRIVEDLLVGRLDASGAPAAVNAVRPEVLHVWRTQLACGGRASVPELAASVGWSERYLRARFQAEFGVGPKTFARLVRFSSARTAMPAALRSGASLASVAAQHGYYDQAHLAAEFRSFAGCAPTAWLAEEFRILQDVEAVREEDSRYERSRNPRDPGHP